MALKSNCIRPLIVPASIRRLFKSSLFPNAYERARKAVNKAGIDRFRTIKNRKKTESAVCRETNKGRVRLSTASISENFD